GGGGAVPGHPALQPASAAAVPPCSIDRRSIVCTRPLTRRSRTALRRGCPAPREIRVPPRSPTGSPLPFLRSTRRESRQTPLGSCWYRGGVRSCRADHHGR